MIVSLMWERYGVFANESIESYERNEHCSYREGLDLEARIRVS